MSDRGRTTTLRSLIALAALTTASATAPATAAAQEAGEALRYELRTADGPAVQALTAGAAEEPSAPDVSADRTPKAVIQGPEVTLVGPLDEGLNWDNAGLHLVDGTPVREGVRGTLLASWPEPGDGLEYEPVRVEVRRGDGDARVAGREAKHYVLEAELLRHHPNRDHRYRITSELWVLEGLPFTWAPFGAHTTSVPSYDPRLRAAMEEELMEIGLVARAVTTVDFELIDPGGEPGDPSNGGSKSVTAFEISNLSRVAAPERPPAPVVSREFTERLERMIMSDPAGVCARATAGEMLDILRENVPEPHREAVLSELATGCREMGADLYLGILMAEVEEAGEWGPVCARITFADGPEAFARSAFPDEKTAEGFLAMLSEEEQREAMDRIQPACEKE